MLLQQHSDNSATCPRPPSHRPGVLSLLRGSTAECGGYFPCTLLPSCLDSLSRRREGERELFSFPFPMCGLPSFLPLFHRQQQRPRATAITAATASVAEAVAAAAAGEHGGSFVGMWESERRRGVARLYSHSLPGPTGAFLPFPPR